MLKIFLTFIYTGFLAFGGGLATIPILYQLMVLPGEILEEDFYNMIAISQATPGPVGLNLATYVGFSEGGILGALVASCAIAIPSLLGVSILARIYEKVKNNKTMLRVMKVLRSAICGIVVIAVLKLLKNSLFNLPEGMVANKISDYISFLNYIDYSALILMTLFILFMRFSKKKYTPAIYIVVGGILGIFLF